MSIGKSTRWLDFRNIIETETNGSAQLSTWYDLILRFNTIKGESIVNSYPTQLSNRLSILHTCLPIDLSLTVNSFLDHRPYSTLLQTNTSNNSVIMNVTFSITCTTEANPPAKYEIYRDETTFVGNNSVVTSSVTERVKRVTFTCKPSNFYGIGQMADVSLDVLCKWNCCDSVC